MRILTFFLTIYLTNQCLCDETIEISLKQGAVLGKVEKTLAKKQDYYTFKGIPFAEPPVEKLRFLPPKPHEGWNGQLEAFDNKPTCTQLSIKFRNKEPFGISGSEDCLYISVFTPDVKANAPVIVFEFNDNFRTGFNGTNTYSPDFFVEEGVVVVTISHRLGVFGYLTTEDDVIKGNNGLRDFILGLEWVKDNIQQFGGDSSKVTLMGSLGGAVMADMLLYSERAKGLFSAAILQSGTSLESMFFYRKPKEKAFLLGKVLNIETDDSIKLLKGLQKIDSEKLLRSTFDTLEDDPIEAIQIGSFPYSPTVEHDTKDGIITSLPEKGKIVSDVPIIIGFNSRDGLDLISQVISYPKITENGLEETILHFPIRSSFRFDPNSTVFKEASKDILDFYHEDKSIHYGNILEYAVYAGDSYKIYAIDFAANQLARRLSSSVFYYMFDFRGQFNENSLAITSLSRIVLKHTGATITDELCYLVVCSRLERTYENTLKMASEQNEMKVLKRLVRMWSNFAKTRNPTPTADDDILKGFIWNPIGQGPENNYLHISRKLSMKTNPLGERKKFWDDFMEKYSKMAVDGIVTDQTSQNESTSNDSSEELLIVETNPDEAVHIEL